MTKRSLVATERQEHLALMAWVQYQPWREFLIHIANEYDGGVRGGHLRKLMGVKAGVCDFFLAIPLKGYAGLWIELKRRSGGTVSEKQKNWIKLMQSVGYRAEVCYGWDEAKNLLSKYASDFLLEIESPAHPPVRLFFDQKL